MEELRILKKVDDFIHTVANNAMEIEGETKPYPVCTFIFTAQEAVAMYFGPFHEYMRLLDDRDFRIQEDGSVSIRFKKDDNYDCVPACDLEKKIKDAVEADGKATLISIVPYYIPEAPGRESKQFAAYVMVSDDDAIKGIKHAEYTNKYKILIGDGAERRGVLADQVEDLRTRCSPEEFKKVIDGFVRDRVDEPPFVRHFPTSLSKQPGMFDRLFDTPCRR